MRFLDDDEIYLIDVNKDIKTFIQELNDYCINNQEDREYVEEKNMLVARDIVLNLYPKNELDCLVYASALNILNTYVKKANHSEGMKIDYYFKKYVSHRLLKAIVDNNLNINMYLTYDNGMTVCYIEYNDMIFSFHQVYLPYGYENKILSYPNYKEIYFDGIRKQFVSVTIFKNILNLYENNK